MHIVFVRAGKLCGTHKGYLKSEGVAPLQRIKASLKKSKSGGHNGRAG